MSDTANPEVPADPGAATQNPTPGFDQALASVQGLLEPDGPTTPETEEPEGQPEAEPEAEPEAQADGEDAELQEAEPEAAAEDSEEPEEPSTYEVKVNGETSQVSLAELQSGYQRDADYRQKTAEVAETKRSHEEAVTQARTQWHDRLGAADALIQEAVELHGAMESPSPNLLDDTRPEYDPNRYHRDRAAFEASQERIRKVMGKRQEAVNVANQDAVTNFNTFRTAEQAKLESVLPDWGDPEKGPKLKSNLRTFLKGEGFDDQEMKGLVDSRQVNIAVKAMRYDALQKKQPGVRKKLAKTPKMKKPGAGADRGGGDKQRASMNRLRKSGRQEDAYAFVQGLLDGN